MHPSEAAGRGRERRREGYRQRGSEKVRKKERNKERERKREKREREKRERTIEKKERERLGEREREQAYTNFMQHRGGEAESDQHIIGLEPSASPPMPCVQRNVRRSSYSQRRLCLFSAPCAPCDSVRFWSLGGVL